MKMQQIVMVLYMIGSACFFVGTAISMWAALHP